ncbi:fimbria/pilus outer membrane usher protein [Halomonas sp. V046]|uniref:fimbria/pilus outer membrane usher protein n=1 Tax=Halomonas sp. V046 TaxID=3459611 RepID=UPI004043FDF6
MSTAISQQTEAFSALPVSRGQHLSRQIAASLMVVLGIALTHDAHANDHAETKPVRFNRAFLEDPSLDISRFSDAGYITPGEYALDVWLNGRLLERASVEVGEPGDAGDRGGAQRITLPASLILGQLGTNARAAVKRHCARASKAPAPVLDAAFDEALTHCRIAAGDISPDASAALDLADLSLRLNVPQAALPHSPRGATSLAQWDPGTTALLANYSVNGYQADIDGERYRSGFLGMSFGANLGLWQYRSDVTASWQEDSAIDWETSRHYVQRPIASQGLLLQLGDVHTQGDLFDAIAVRGATLRSDPRMLPDSQRGYAPIVRGTARTNARVRITQHELLLLETTVPPGPFAITDLYPTGYGGDLTVTVLEADGEQRQFDVPYAAIPNLLRPGQVRVSLAAGRLNSAGLDDKPKVIEASYRRGLGNRLTAYGGIQYADDYASPLVGAALNTPIGAVGLDAAYAHAKLSDATAAGWNLRASYSRHLSSTDTDVNLAAYRYSTSQYLSLRDAAYLRDRSDQREFDLDAHAGIDRRNNLQLNLSQRLGNLGSLTASASLSDYWHRRGTRNSYQLGYSNSLGRLSYNLSLARTQTPGDDDNDDDLQLLMSVSLPLGNTAFAPRLSVSASHDNDGQQDVNVAVSGTLGETRNLSYGLYANIADSPDARSETLGGSVSTSTAIGQFSASGSKSADYRQASLGANGAFLVHSGGITFGPTTGDTVGLLQAEGGHGAGTTNALNVTIDDAGYALLPFLSPYHENVVVLDPQGASERVEFLTTTRRVVPYAGAVVALHYPTRTGTPTLVVLTLAGRGVPMGSEVFDDQGRRLGVVGAGGMWLARDLPRDARLVVHVSANERCHVQLAPGRDEASLPPTSLSGIAEIDAECIATSPPSRPEASTL